MIPIVEKHIKGLARFKETYAQTKRLLKERKEPVVPKKEHQALCYIKLQEHEQRKRVLTKK